MVPRLLSPLRSRSFFLFGARGTGKSTFVEEAFVRQAERTGPSGSKGTKAVKAPKTLTIDLLDVDEEDRFSRNPRLLESMLDELPALPDWIFIDEVQKVPRILDQVHRLIEKRKLKFILSGSSARKLKRQGANLLAGRAMVNHMHPFTARELGGEWDLQRALEWGTLPQCWSSENDEERRAYLKSYVQTYLREEIRMEQLVRRLEPFRAFLEVSAQMNGKVLNLSRIAREVGVTDKTIQGYFEILQDTLVGFFLPAFHRSARKGQSGHPKFYWFDPGVKRQLERSIESRLVPSTGAYGEAFEHWVILEITRLADYLGKDWTYSYFRTKEGKEIDLVISPDRKSEILVEIKSSSRVDPIEVNYLSRLSREFNARGVFYLSQDPKPQKIGNVRCLPWMQGVEEILALS